jgi:hypothetical protein
MARLIKTDTPAKARHEHMRSCAEVLRLLAQKSAFDDEAKDMSAFLVFNLRDIYRIIDESAQVWDERNYWKKSEKLRHDWRWSRLAADQITKTIIQNRWSELPEFLISLVPHFSSISVSTITRDSDWWCGAHRALQKEQRPD